MADAEFLFNIFAVSGFIFCLLHIVFKNLSEVLAVICLGVAAILVITAFCTGGFNDSLHSFISLLKSGK